MANHGLMNCAPDISKLSLAVAPFPLDSARNGSAWLSALQLSSAYRIASRPCSRIVVQAIGCIARPGNEGEAAQQRKLSCSTVCAAGQAEAATCHGAAVGRQSLPHVSMRSIDEGSLRRHRCSAIMKRVMMSTAMP